MFSLATIQRMNNVVEVAKARRRAKALNNPGEHPKGVEKGQRIPRKMGGSGSAVDNKKFGRISSVAH